MFMIPCEECLVYVLCKMRERKRAEKYDYKWGASVIGLAEREECDALSSYLTKADQDKLNEVRVLFDMHPYK